MVYLQQNAHSCCIPATLWCPPEPGLCALGQMIITGKGSPAMNRRTVQLPIFKPSLLC